MIYKIALSLLIALIVLIIIFFTPFARLPEPVEGDLRSFQKKREDNEHWAFYYLRYIAVYILLGIFICFLVFLFIVY